MPRGHRLLIGREVAGEIFPGPHLALGFSAHGAFSWQMFFVLTIVALSFVFDN